MAPSECIQSAEFSLAKECFQKTELVLLTVAANRVRLVFQRIYHYFCLNDPESLACRKLALDLVFCLKSYTHSSKFCLTTKPQHTLGYKALITYQSATVAQVLPEQLVVSVAKIGDANNDNRVDEADRDIWKAHYLQSVAGANNGDFSGDGRVNGIDYIVWLNHYGT